MGKEGVAVSGLPSGESTVVKVRFPRLVADPAEDELVRHLIRALVRRVGELSGAPTAASSGAASEFASSGSPSA